MGMVGITRVGSPPAFRPEAGHRRDRSQGSIGPGRLKPHDRQSQRPDGRPALLGATAGCSNAASS
jgi:hypothetical protein